MNKDEALKMAIEALQNNQTYDWKGNPLTALDEANEKVINACKEALEQPAPEYDINELIDKITPENLQEPRSIMESFDKMLAEKLVYYKKKRTAQEPLSDDEIQKTWYNLYPLDENNLWTDMLEGEHLRKFARAIEQAHGIGESDGQTHNSSNEWNISGTRD